MPSTTNIVFTFSSYRYEPNPPITETRNKTPIIIQSKNRKHKNLTVAVSPKALNRKGWLGYELMLLLRKIKRKKKQNTLQKKQGWITNLAALLLNFLALLMRTAKLTLKCRDSHLNISLEIRKTIALSGFEMTLEGT